MKYIPLLLLLYAVSFNSVAQTVDETLKKSNQLVVEKKYNSAFDLLDKADPKNDNAEIVLAKEDIVLGYFVTSIMHKMFALKDLKPGEDVADYRGKAGSYSMHVFPADSILNRLVKTQPGNYKLYKGLGNYYYEVYLHYNANWVENAETLLGLIEENYGKVVTMKAADYMTWYELGYVNLVQKKYKDATTCFLSSIELNNNYANAYYNLAYAYLYQDDRTNALKYAIKSIDIYQDKSYKGDAARMTGEIYGELKDAKNEIYYYELSDKIDAGNYYTLKALLKAYVNSNNDKEKQTLNRFYQLSPENPTIYNDLETIYASRETDLEGFYESKLPVYKNNNKVYGSLCFYLAKLYLSSDKPKAKSYLTQAKSALSKVFEKDNGVFAAIDTLMQKAQ